MPLEEHLGESEGKTLNVKSINAVGDGSSEGVNHSSEPQVKTRLPTQPSLPPDSDSVNEQAIGPDESLGGFKPRGKQTKPTAGGRPVPRPTGRPK